MSSFDELPREVQELIRSRQADAKRKRLAAKSAKSDATSPHAALPSPPTIQLPSSATVSAASPLSQPCDGSQFPDTVSMDAYFAAASGGLFRDARITATLSGVDTLLRLIALPGNSELRSCNYFMFSGTVEQQWDPTLLAKLAYEGFFTITHGSRSGSAVPLPELQPM